ncbi:MAG: oligosaccharide flippase family protein [Bacteroidales bacterium]|nr:oligosaccharide flippase family protein [Bacteroidales bacterium]
MIRAIRNIWKNEFFKNVATLISGTTLAQAFSVIIYVVLSRIYTEEDFGVFGLYMNILNIVVIFSTARYDQAILLPKSDRESMNLLGLSGLISVGISLVLLLLVVPLNDTICRWLGSNEISTWLYFIPLSTLLVAWFTILKNHANRDKQYRLIAGANIGQSVGNSLTKLGLGFLVAGAAGLISGVVFGQLAGFLVFFAIQLPSLRMRGSWLSFSEMRRLGRKYSFFPKFNMWQALINNLSAAFPVFLFSSFFSTTIAGFYTFGFMIIHRPVHLVGNAFYQVIFQRFVEKSHNKEPILPELYLFIRRALQVMLVPFILMGIFAPEIFGFVFGENWTEAGVYARFMLPWIFMVGLAMPLSFMPDMYREQRKAMIIDGIRLFLRLLGMVIGIVYNNIYLALVLYSGASTLLIGVNLIWYIQLARKLPPADPSEHGTDSL